MAKVPNKNTPGDNDHTEGSSGETDKRGQLPIIGHGSYSPSDMRDLQWMAMTVGTDKKGRKELFWISITLSVAFIALFVLSIFEEGNSQPIFPPTSPEWFPLLVMIGLLVALSAIAFKMINRMKNETCRDFEDGKGIFEPWTVSLDENGLVAKAPSMSISYCWPAFTEIVRRDEVIALKGHKLGVGAITNWVLLPRRFFDDTNWTALLLMAQEKIGKPTE